MLELYHQGKIRLEKIVEKMCHTPLFVSKLKTRIHKRGICSRLVLVEIDKPWEVKDNILYNALGLHSRNTFKSRVTHTWVNGHLAYQNGSFDESQKGHRLTFDR